MSRIQVAMQKWREISIEAPEEAEDTDFPIPFGMKGWKNSNGFTVVACHYSSDPEKCSDEWYEAACKGLRPDQIARELEISFDSKAGTKVFPFLEPADAIYRIDPPDPIPHNWKIIAGMDYGARNPTAFVWFAVDEHRRFWAFDEFYVPMNQFRGGLPEFCRYLKGHRYYPRLLYISGDPKMFARDQNLIMKETGQQSYGTLLSIADLMIKEGIHKLQRGNNDRMAGLSRLQQLFNWRGDMKLSKPALFIGKRCNKMWWEFNNLVFKLDDNLNKNADEDVVKRNDHIFDLSKYCALSQDAPAEQVGDRRSGFATLDQIEKEIDEMHNSKERDVFACSFSDLDGAYESYYDY